ncbi:MAG: helix-turn-helix transcriptional regulator [Acetobacteraceae bacterium]
MPKVDPDILSSLIGDIYDCALDATKWVPTLRRLAGLLDACAGNIMSFGGAGITFSYQWGTPEDAMRDYARTYASIDPMFTVAWHAEIDEPITAGQFIGADELRATRFHREFLAPLGWFDFIMVALEKSAAGVTSFGFTLPEGAEPPSDDDRALIRLLAPHVRRSAIMHGIIQRDSARAAMLAAGFDLLPMPILLFGADGACLQANEAARRFMTDTDVLHLDNGALRARDRSMNAQIGAALSPGGIVADARAGPRSLALTQKDGRQFVAHVMPVTGTTRAIMGIGDHAVTAMFVQEVGTLQPLPGEVLVKLYGLTPAETRLIALLAADRTIEVAAADLGIARTTARTHLQHIFDKTGTSRQSELMRLVLSALPR